MQIRLKTRPGLYHVSGGHTFVGTFDRRWWFIVTAQTHAKNGKDYPGYLALWRFRKNYRTQHAATAAAERWLQIPLT